MDLNAAKTVMERTHIAALDAGYRANGLYLESGPGLGKSDAVFQTAAALAAHLNVPVGLVVFMLATISSVDVRGFMLPTKPVEAGGAMGTIFSLPPWYPVRSNMIVIEPDGTVHREGTWTGETPQVGILFLDEFAQAEDEVKKPAAELIYKGNVGPTELPRGWRVIAAGNRMSDRSGVMRELMFIVNRRCKLSIDASLPAWLSWANAQPPHLRPHYLSMSFAQKNPDLVFRDAVPPGSDPFCTPRTLCLMDRDLQALRSPDDIKKDRMPLDGIAREVAAGWIGGGEAAQYYTHLKYADELPDIADIERDPATAKLPPNRDAQMVAGYMLAHGVNKRNADKVMGYLKRMQIEMQVLSVRAITAQQERAKDIVNSQQFSAWLLKNKELLFASRA
jgi:hypothetical protein